MLGCASHYSIVRFDRLIAGPLILAPTHLLRVGVFLCANPWFFAPNTCFSCGSTGIFGHCVCACVCVFEILIEWLRRTFVRVCGPVVDDAATAKLAQAALPQAGGAGGSSGGVIMVWFFYSCA